MKARLIKCTTGFDGHAYKKFVRIRIRVRGISEFMSEADLCPKSYRCPLDSYVHVESYLVLMETVTGKIPMFHIKILILERWFRFWSFIRFENTFLYHKHASQWPNNPNALKYYFTFFEKVDSGEKIPSWYVESSLSDKKDLEKVKLMVDWRHSNHSRFSVYYSLTNCIKSEPNHFLGLNRGWMNHHQFYRNYWTGLAWFHEHEIHKLVWTGLKSVLKSAMLSVNW